MLNIALERANTLASKLGVDVFNIVPPIKEEIQKKSWGQGTINKPAQ